MAFVRVITHSVYTRRTNTLNVMERLGKRLYLIDQFVQFVRTDTVDGRTQSWRERDASTEQLTRTHIHGNAWPYICFPLFYAVATGNHNRACVSIVTHFFQSQPETINQLKHRLRSCTTGNIARGRPRDPSLVQYFP